MQSGSPKEDTVLDAPARETITSSVSPNDMQMIYDSQIGEFISIHEHESNVVVCDSVKYVDNNFNQALEFTTLSSSRVNPNTRGEAWSNFWERKYHANNKLLRAVEEGKQDLVMKLLNPLQKVDDQAEARYCNSDGFAAIHLSIIFDRLSILKVLLDIDKTLLSMQTENERK